MKHKAIAIITARGGSKRIPRKNIRLFLGKPIIEYSIIAALDSECFDEVMVSTDDQEIASLAEKLHTNIPFFRSKGASDDFATTCDVLLEVLQLYDKQGQNFDYACCIYPTAPFITAEKLKKGYDLLENSGANSVLPVVRFEYPVQRAFEIKGGKLQMLWPENRDVRSQDLKPVYHDAGQFYWFNVEQFLKTRTLFGDNTLPLAVPASEVQDIDTLEDWALAEMKFRMLKK